MSNKPITMRQVKEILRLNLELQLSFNAITKVLGVSKGVVAKYIGLAKAAQLDWAQIRCLDELQLAQRILPQPSQKARLSSFCPIDFAWVHHELRRKGVTLQLLWTEYYSSKEGTKYQYSAFCDHYRCWTKKQKLSMRQVHLAGEKLFVDYAGPKVQLIDALTGEVTQASIFVAVLGASNYTFVLATASQKMPDWLLGQRRAFEYFGGTPHIIVPDNPKALVAMADRYEPQIGRTYQEFANHYGCVVIPARPYKPQDKGKVENGVLIVERWILARLRHQEFFNLAGLNDAIAALLEDLNIRAFKQLPGNRRSTFIALDQPALKPLPPTPFEFATWKKARVGIDYHVQLDRHFYSVPYTLVKEEVELRYTATRVDVLHRGQCVSSHPRVLANHYGHPHSTLAEHLPKSHQAHLEWTPSRLILWGQSIGPCCGHVIEHLLRSKPHPEMGYRACLGVLHLSKRYGKDRLEATCQLALEQRAMNLSSLRNILKRKLDQTSSQRTKSDHALPPHENIRGSNYYH